MTTKKIEALRATIREHQTEIANIEAQPVSRQCVADQVAVYVERARYDGRARAAAALQRIAAGHAGNPLVLPITLYTNTGPVAGRVDLAPVMAMLLGSDVLVGALTRDIDAIPEGLEPKARFDSLQRLRETLLQLETDEEASIRLLEATGEHVYRRPDADPRALVA